MKLQSPKEIVLDGATKDLLSQLSQAIEELNPQRPFFPDVADEEVYCSSSEENDMVQTKGKPEVILPYMYQYQASVDNYYSIQGDGIEMMRVIS